MKVTLDFDKGICKVEKESNDPVFYNSGWSSAESIFLYHVKKELIKQGYDVIKKKMCQDGHLVDEHQHYIRTRYYMYLPDDEEGSFCIYDNFYNVRNVADAFNHYNSINLILAQ